MSSSSPMSLSSCCRRVTSFGRWTMSSILLLSLFSSSQRMSFNTEMPKPETEDMNTCGMPSGNVGSISSINSWSSISLLVTANTRCLSNISGLKVRSSFSKTSYSLRMSSLSAGTINSSNELRSIWRKKRSPKPFPWLAPSIIPGMSAITKDFPPW